jgi:hypothetical protein
MMGRNHLEDLGIDGTTIRMDLREKGWVWNGFIWLRKETSGGLL